MGCADIIPILLNAGADWKDALIGLCEVASWGAIPK
jgi:hypothetical protein